MKATIVMLITLTLLHSLEASANFKSVVKPKIPPKETKDLSVRDFRKSLEAKIGKKAANQCGKALRKARNKLPQNSSAEQIQNYMASQSCDLVKLGVGIDSKALSGEFKTVAKPKSTKSEGTGSDLKIRDYRKSLESKIGKKAARQCGKALRKARNKLSADASEEKISEYMASQGCDLAKLGVEGSKEISGDFKTVAKAKGSNDASAINDLKIKDFRKSLEDKIGKKAARQCGRALRKARNKLPEDSSAEKIQEYMASQNCDLAKLGIDTSAGSGDFKTVAKAKGASDAGGLSDLKIKDFRKSLEDKIGKKAARKCGRALRKARRKLPEDSSVEKIKEYMASNECDLAALGVEAGGSSEVGDLEVSFDDLTDVSKLDPRTSQMVEVTSADEVPFNFSLKPDGSSLSVAATQQDPILRDFCVCKIKLPFDGNQDWAPLSACHTKAKKLSEEGMKQGKIRKQEGICRGKELRAWYKQTKQLDEKEIAEFCKAVPADQAKACAKLAKTDISAAETCINNYPPEKDSTNAYMSAARGACFADSRAAFIEHINKCISDYKDYPEGDKEIKDCIKSNSGCAKLPNEIFNKINSNKTAGIFALLDPALEKAEFKDTCQCETAFKTLPDDQKECKKFVRKNVETKTLVPAECQHINKKQQPEEYKKCYASAVSRETLKAAATVLAERDDAVGFIARAGLGLGSCLPQDFLRELKSIKCPKYSNMDPHCNVIAEKKCKGRTGDDLEACAQSHSILSYKFEKLMECPGLVTGPIKDWCVGEIKNQCSSLPQGDEQIACVDGIIKKAKSDLAADPTYNAIKGNADSYGEQMAGKKPGLEDKRVQAGMCMADAAMNSIRELLPDEFKNGIGGNLFDAGQAALNCMRETNPKLRQACLAKAALDNTANALDEKNPALATVLRAGSNAADCTKIDKDLRVTQGADGKGLTARQACYGRAALMGAADLVKDEKAKAILNTAANLSVCYTTPAGSSNRGSCLAQQSLNSIGDMFEESNPELAKAAKLAGTALTVAQSMRDCENSPDKKLCYAQSISQLMPGESGAYLGFLIGGYSIFKNKCTAPSAQILKAGAVVGLSGDIYNHIAHKVGLKNLKDKWDDQKNKEGGFDLQVDSLRYLEDIAMNDYRQLRNHSYFVYTSTALTSVGNTMALFEAVKPVPVVYPGCTPTVTSLTPGQEYQPKDIAQSFETMKFLIAQADKEGADLFANLTEAEMLSSSSNRSLSLDEWEQNKEKWNLLSEIQSYQVQVMKQSLKSAQELMDLLVPSAHAEGKGKGNALEIGDAIVSMAGNALFMKPGEGGMMSPEYHVSNVVGIAIDKATAKMKFAGKNTVALGAKLATKHVVTKMLKASEKSTSAFFSSAVGRSIVAISMNYTSFEMIKNTAKSVKAAKRHAEAAKQTRIKMEYDQPAGKDYGFESVPAEAVEIPKDNKSTFYKVLDQVYQNMIPSAYAQTVNEAERTMCIGANGIIDKNCACARSNKCFKLLDPNNKAFLKHMGDLRQIDPKLFDPAFENFKNVSTFVNSMTSGKEIIDERKLDKIIAATERNEKFNKQMIKVVENMLKQKGKTVSLEEMAKKRNPLMDSLTPDLKELGTTMASLSPSEISSPYQFKNPEDDPRIWLTNAVAQQKGGFERLQKIAEASESEEKNLDDSVGDAASLAADITPEGSGESVEVAQSDTPSSTLGSDEEYDIGNADIAKENQDLWFNISKRYRSVFTEEFE